MVSILHLFDRHFHLPYACCSLLIICIAISGGQRWYRRRRLSRLRGCLAGRTYPHLDPYIGLGLVRRVVDAYNAKRVLQLWQDLQTEIGHTFHFWVFGERNLVTDEPENVKAILSTEFASFDHGPNRHHAYAPLLGDGIFAVDGARWRDSRALLRPNFAKSQICDVDLFERHFGNFLRALPANNVPVDLQEMFKRLSMDIITEMLFGSSTGTLTRKDGDDLNAFSSGCEYSQKVVWRKIAFGWKAKLWPDSKDRRSRQILHDTVDQYVQQWVPQEQRRSDKKKRAGSDQSRYVFLEHLAERTQDPKVLRDQLLSTLLGGRDTTSTLLSNLFWILARSPSMWCKLREEANSPDLQLLNRESLKKASFARQCLQECECSCDCPIYKSSKPRLFPGGPSSERGMLICACSIETSPCRAHQPAMGEQRHRSATRWWFGGRFSIAGAPRLQYVHQRVGDAQAKRHLGRGCRRVQAGAVGKSPSWVGICALWRRATDMYCS